MARENGVKYQIIFSPFVFASQLLFTFNCSQDLSALEFKQTMLIIGLTMFLQFSDIGGLSAAYITGKIFYHSRKFQDFCHYIGTFRYLKAISSVGIFAALLLEFCNLIDSKIFLFIACSMVNQSLAWYLVSARVFVSEFKYSLFFNSSWPISISLLYISKILNFDLSKLYFILPISASIIANLLIIPSTQKIIDQYKRNIHESRFVSNTQKMLNHLFLKTFLINILGVLSIYSDRYILNLNSDLYTVNKYIIYVQVPLGCVTLINTLYTINSRVIVNLDLNNQLLTKTFRNYGIIIILLAIISIYFLIHFFYRLQVDHYMIFFIIVFLMLYIILRREQINFSLPSNLLIQIKGNILQIISMPFIYFSLVRFPHEYAIAISLIISIALNWLYLYSKR